MSEESWLTIYGAPWCPECLRCRTFLAEHGVPYHWVDVVEHPEVTAEIEERTGGQQVLPTIIFPDDDVFTRPSNHELAAKLGLDIHVDRKFWPLIVVGAGPAGLTASLFAAGEATDTLVIERELIGGNANVGYVENMPGFPDPIPGLELSNRLREQVETLGVEILQASDIVAIESEHNYHRVVTSDGDRYSSNAVIIATGCSYRRLGIPGEEEFISRGVHFSAASDGPFYRGQHVAVVGGGNSAVEAALDLASFASTVSLLVREDFLTANSMNQDRLTEHDNVEVLYRTTPQEFSGGSNLSAIRTRNEESGEERDLVVSGAFVFVGLTPNSAFLEEGAVLLDGRGFVSTGNNLARHDGGLAGYADRDPFLMESSVPGVFAAGDVREGSTKLVATAAGEGATAAMLVREYLRGVAFRAPATARPRRTG